MTFAFIPDQELPSTSEVEAFEEKIGFKLPQDYREFLLKYNGARWELENQNLDNDLCLGFSVDATVRDIGGESFYFDGFNPLHRNPDNYGILQMYEVAMNYWDHLRELLPFAHTAGGIHLFICLSDNHKGGIFIAADEFGYKRLEELPLSVDDYSMIAASFTEFLTMLEWM
jgi:hypothetical protein